MPISNGWLWSTNVRNQYLIYRNNPVPPKIPSSASYYPPKKVTGASHYPNPNIPNPSNQGYGDDFYTTYSFEE